MGLDIKTDPIFKKNNTIEISECLMITDSKSFYVKKYLQNQIFSKNWIKMSSNNLIFLLHKNYFTKTQKPSTSVRFWISI